MPRKYPDEFRARAVALVRSGQTVTKTADDLGITDSCLYGWVKHDRIDHGEIKAAYRAESRELRKVKSRVRELENEVTILRRANALLRAYQPVTIWTNAASPDRGSISSGSAASRNIPPEKRRFTAAAS